MDIQTYMQLAPRTYAGDKLEILTLGFMGEPGELIDLLKKESRGKEIPREQWLEEISDAVWYPVVWCHVNHIDFETLYASAKRRSELRRSGDLRTLFREMNLHGVELDETDQWDGSIDRQTWQVECYLSCWEHARNLLGFTLEEIFDYNITKLSKRYAHLLEKDNADG
jgi:NTP pyrophosphatase (non-canonical NTP hydrolase)